MRSDRIDEVGPAFVPGPIDSPFYCRVETPASARMAAGLSVAGWLGDWDDLVSSTGPDLTLIKLLIFGVGRVADLLVRSRDRLDLCTKSIS
jgi:hypothetical protein